MARRVTLRVAVTGGLVLLVAAAVAVVALWAARAPRGLAHVTSPAGGSSTLPANGPSILPAVNVAVRWVVPPGELPPSVADSLRTAVESSDELRGLVPPARYLEVTHGSVSADLGLFYSRQRYAADGQLVPTEPLVFLVNRSGSGWRIYTPDDPDFCTILGRLPDNVLSALGKEYYIGCPGPP